MKSEYFKYGVLDMFCSEHYKNIITDNDLTELKSFNFKIDKDDIYTVKGWVVKKNRRRYLIKDNIGNENLLNILPIKIVESKEFVYRNDVYNVPTTDGIARFKIPAEETMTVNDWFDSFAPFIHTNPSHFKLYKALVLCSLVTRFNYRVATQPGFGKNSIPSLLRSLMPFEVSVYTPKSAPKLLSVLEKRLLVIDEFIDIAEEHQGLLEPVIREAGDMRTSIENSALSVPGYTKDTYDISKLSLVFTYNEYADYMSKKNKKGKEHKYFDFAVTEATNQRFIPLRLHGELDINQFGDGDKSETEIYGESKIYLKNWIKMAKWLMDGGYYGLLKEKEKVIDKSKVSIDLKSERHKSHFNTIVNFLVVISRNQKEFDEYIKDLVFAYYDYLNMLDGLK